MYNTITHERYQDKQRIFDTFEPSAPFQTVVSPFIILDTKNNSAVSSNHILDNNLKMAQDLIRQKNLPQSEIYLQRYLALNEHNFFSRQLLNDLRQGYGLSEPFTLSEKSSSSRTQKEKFLLIKAWGCGFWSEVHHLLGQLLLAELTCRTPIILWGRNCLFRNDLNPNPFRHFFKEVSRIKLQNISSSATIFPPKWDWNNILNENNNLREGDYSRLAAQYLFNRPETMVVTDFYSTISSIIPWIHQSSKYFGKTDDELYAEMFKKYIKPVASLEKKVEIFWKRYMAGRPWVGVHVRGSDKCNEMEFECEQLDRINAFNAFNYECIDRIIELNPGIGVFLLTDSETVLKEYRMRYGDKLLFTEATRSASNVGVHFMNDLDGIKIGEEVLLDSLLAAKCDYFVGNLSSNVSLAIQSMRNWPIGLVKLIGNNARKESLYLHDRSQTPVFAEISRNC